jgi:hypothetical protein
MTRRNRAQSSGIRRARYGPTLPAADVLEWITPIRRVASQVNPTIRAAATGTGRMDLPDRRDVLAGRVNQQTTPLAGQTPQNPTPPTTFDQPANLETPTGTVDYDQQHPGPHHD